MTRTSQALKRLGVAAIAVATIGAGVPAFFATAASATNATNTGVTITPTQEAGAINTCNPYSVQVTPADTTTVDIQISQAPDTGTATIQFCDPGTGTGNGRQAAPNGNAVTTASLIGPQPAGGNVCPQPSSGTTVTCDAEYNTDGQGRLTFGVQSSHTGTVSVTAFVEATNAPATPSPNATGNNAPDGTEHSATATKYVVTNANNSVTSITCTPTSGNNAVGDTHFFSCTAFTTSGSNSQIPVRGVQIKQAISSGPDRSPPATFACGQSSGTATAPAIDQTTAYGTFTNNQGVVTCKFTNNGQPGTDTIVNYVDVNNDNIPQTTEPNATITKTFAGAARFINCTPKSPTVAYGVNQTITCTVTDLNGNPVPNTNVYFQASFPGGRFTTTGTAQATVVTNASGVAAITINNPDQTTTQTQTVTATIGNATRAFTSADTTAECNQAAGTTTQPGQTTTATTPAAGKCSDSVTITYTTGSPSPSASTSTAPGTARPVLSTSTPDIQPNIQGIYTVTGATPNSVVELRCYTRPSTTYFTARSTTVNAAGGPVEFRILPGANTRCYARPAGNDALASNSVVINVHTTLSLSTVRTGVRTYIFQGRNLPRRAGQLITLYRVTASGQEIRTSNLVTDASGIYRVTRKFTGTGTFRFKVRTSQTLNNAAGVSNTITVTVH